jgi:Fe-Mn family superoxide dismutase
MTQYTLPELPYDYAALEPNISARIMELHHDKHHATYVAGANKALEQLAEAREKNDFANVAKYSKDLAFNLGGHTNHSIFWNNLSPEGGDRPEGELAAAIDDAFGSFEAFQAHFTQAALGLQGSGWAFLALEGLGGNLVIEQLYDQQGNVPVATTPLLMLDMWEHAFYLDYVNVKADYVKAFWNIVNWADVAKRFEAARAGPHVHLPLHTLEIRAQWNVSAITTSGCSLCRLISSLKTRLHGCHGHVKSKQVRPPPAPKKSGGVSTTRRCVPGLTTARPGRVGGCKHLAQRRGLLNQGVKQ